MAQIIGTFYKAPGDTLKQSIDFGPDLPTGATLASAACPVVPSGLTVPAVTNDTRYATPTITGGRKGESYELEIVGTYSDGEVRAFGVTVVVL